MLAVNMRRANSRAWLVNTGWTGGGYGVGKRMDLAYTRAIIDAIHSGELDNALTTVDPLFGLHIPLSCRGVPDELLVPVNTWPSAEQYKAAAHKVASLFAKNFEKFATQELADVRAAGPLL
jgi:phosphoenolpyruvate carboxykinase (ATP)